MMLAAKCSFFMCPLVWNKYILGNKMSRNCGTSISLFTCFWWKKSFYLPSQNLFTYCGLIQRIISGMDVRLQFNNSLIAFIQN